MNTRIPRYTTPTPTCTYQDIAMTCLIQPTIGYSSVKPSRYLIWVLLHGHSSVGILSHRNRSPHAENHGVNVNMASGSGIPPVRDFGIAHYSQAMASVCATPKPKPGGATLEGIFLSTGKIGHGTASHHEDAPHLVCPVQEAVLVASCCAAFLGTSMRYNGELQTRCGNSTMHGSAPRPIACMNARF
jgi:hypothetical protein